MKQVDRGVRFYQWTRRRGRNVQIAVFGTILLIGCLGIAVIVGLINTITGDDSGDEVAVSIPTATPTATEIELTATPEPTATKQPATAGPEPTATEPPAESIATEQPPSEPTAVSNQPPSITDAGRAYVQQAHEFLDELDAKLPTIDPDNVDESDWGAWSHDWNTRRQTAYEECTGKGNLEVGVLSCLPLGDLFNVWAAEDNRLLDQDSELMNVDTARQSLQDDFDLLEQQ